MIAGESAEAGPRHSEPLSRLVTEVPPSYTFSLSRRIHLYPEELVYLVTWGCRSVTSRGPHIPHPCF